jgi:hypothetical protein
MKHTNFAKQIIEIKNQEYKELFKAVEAHGNYYEWDFDRNEHPIIAVNTRIPDPMDMEIEKVYIEDGFLYMEGVDKEWGNRIDFEVSDVFAGHLGYVIDCIPETDTVKDVTGA